MPVERSPEIAARRYIETLSSVASCVTHQRLATLTSYFTPGIATAIRFPNSPVSLRSPQGGPRGLQLDVINIFAVDAEPEVFRSQRRWSASERMYQYRLLDHAERELLVYHWQPGEEFRGPDHPHLHVGAELAARVNAVETEAIDLASRHVATGLVSFAAVVRMAIDEFGATPMRSDWREFLDRADSVLRFGSLQRR